MSLPWVDAARHPNAAAGRIAQIADGFAAWNAAQGRARDDYRHRMNLLGWDNRRTGACRCQTCAAHDRQLDAHRRKKMRDAR